MAANALFATALLLQATTDPAGIAAPIVALLALQWPIVMLGGVRRFYSRGGTRISEWSDRSGPRRRRDRHPWAPGTSRTDSSPFAQVQAMGTLFLALYVAAAVARLGRLRDELDPCGRCAWGMVAAAIVQVAWLAVVLAYLNPLIAPADAALGAMVSTAVMSLT